MNLGRFLAVVILAVLAVGCCSTASNQHITAITFPANSASTAIEVEDNQAHLVNYALELQQGNFLYLKFRAANADATISVQDPQGKLLYQQHRLDFPRDGGLRTAIKQSGRYLVSIAFPADASKESLSRYAVELTKVSRYSADDVIHISQSVCFGSCPAFNAYLFADGQFVFEGERYTSVIGITKGRISQPQVDTVFNAFNEAQFANFQSNYVPSNQETCGNYTTDQSTLLLTYSTEDNVKKITHYLGCQPSKKLQKLTAIEGLVLQLFERHGLLP